MAFPKGMVPDEGAYSELDLTVAVGFVNAHSIIYCSPGYIGSDWLADFDGWWDNSNPGFECALNIAGGDQKFDSFEPIECSEMIMRTVVVSEIMLVGSDWD